MVRILLSDEPGWLLIPTIRGRLAQNGPENFRLWTPRRLSERLIMVRFSDHMVARVRGSSSNFSISHFCTSPDIPDLRRIYELTKIRVSILQKIAPTLTRAATFETPLIFLHSS